MTVSPRLKIELEKQHHEMDKASNGGLKPTLFFSFRELLLQLLEIKNISDFDDMSPCTYLGFNSSKTSFEKTKVEPHLTESEIGGVICGSLAAAEDRSFLSRSNYLSSKRSNIGRESDQDTDVREYIYDEYEKYSRWKRDSRMYDQSDVVMRLLQEDWPQYFSSGEHSMPYSLSCAKNGSHLAHFLKLAQHILTRSKILR